MSTPKPPASKRRARPSATRAPDESHGKPIDKEPDPVFDGTVLVVAEDGDLVLRIEHETASAEHSHAFRVRSKVLRTGSRFFERLVGPMGFGERVQIEERHRQLEEQHPGTPLQAIPASELPAVTVKDLGRTGNIKNVQALLGDFLNILHGSPSHRDPPVVNLVNLAIVADRFDHLDALRGWQSRKKLLPGIEARTTLKQYLGLAEEKSRQRLLAGMMYDFFPWIEKYSYRIIEQGWTADPSAETDVHFAQWWDLPMRIEEELAYRRQLALETIQSLQTHHIALFMSRERQCRLGYENSAQCDSFQLGEILRFFTRIQSLAVHGTITGETPEEREPYASSLNDLLDTLKQIPEYQIDRHHTHCGIRTHFVPLVGLIEKALLNIGVCADCWRVSGRESLWLHRKRPGVWTKSLANFRRMGHGQGREEVEAMFMAEVRDWGTR
ncbi:hypothetical protein MBLNU230_g7406t1 [Neophaeotheca triangularis]